MITTERTSVPLPARRRSGFDYWGVSVSLASLASAVAVPLACANGLSGWQFAGVGFLVTAAGQARCQFRRLRLHP
ncbi:hypothetical protein ACFRMQ_40225 [Kitasatospora sp. NPDC056783]|uniref:hypothetical protein n=1 Tax=Kitasatospora sp. NPDC056783 TaxID=3345943 RepID=UPI0036C32A32